MEDTNGKVLSPRRNMSLDRPKLYEEMLLKDISGNYTQSKLRTHLGSEPNTNFHNLGLLSYLKLKMQHKY